MRKHVLIDASVWIQATRRGGNPGEASNLEALLKSGRAAMAYPVWMELYQGIRGKKEEDRLASLRELCAWLELDDACWKRAAVVGRACLRAGVSVPFGDVLVFACAERHGVELLERDRHFEMIRKALAGDNS